MLDEELEEDLASLMLITSARQSSGRGRAFASTFTELSITTAAALKRQKDHGDPEFMWNVLSTGFCALE